MASAKFKLDKLAWLEREISFTDLAGVRPVAQSGLHKHAQRGGQTAAQPGLPLLAEQVCA